MKLFTIGYSGYEREEFAEALIAQGVNCVIDIRSLPASRYRPEYDKAAIEKYLKANGIEYRHMPAEFGARQKSNRYINRDGYVDFGLFAGSEAFQRGVYEVDEMARRGMTCALMCAEKDAMNCHRSILVARKFHESGWAVIHLSSEGEERHEELEGRLLDAYFPDRFQISMLEAPKDERKLLSEAYRRQNKKIGFRKEE